MRSRRSSIVPSKPSGASEPWPAARMSSRPTRPESRSFTTRSSSWRMPFEISRWHSQMSCCTKIEWTFDFEPHIRMQASKKSLKVVGPSPSRFMMVWMVAFGTLRLIENALMISCVRGSSRRVLISARVTTPEWSMSALSKSAWSVSRNWSDSATKEASSFSCSTERWIILSTMTPTMRFTRAKLVSTIMPTKYTDHNLFLLMAAEATSGQPSSVTIWKWAKRAVPMDPNCSLTTGSSSYGSPRSSTVTMEPVYMIMPSSSDIQATARMELPMVWTSTTSSLNIRSTRMRRMRRTKRSIRSTVSELRGLSAPEPKPR
mmetsp:Transcript_72449/g.189896  ORF Transcript_72449/g.189896 Transcript_72449/m.189896 type:complete len:317 (+) Transcript_72449:376-1326(+)